MEEEIIIDDVDVSKCKLCERICKNTKKPTVVCKIYEYCTDRPYCYYKQLKRKEQENSKLKETLEIIIETEEPNIDIETEDYIFNMMLPSERLKYHTFISKKILNESEDIQA